MPGTKPKTDIKVALIGEDGNALSIIGRVAKALRRAGKNTMAEDFQREAMSGDYDHLLQTVQEYVEVD